MLLIVGCGDIGVRVAGLLARRWRIARIDVERRRASMRCALPASRPLVGDLDDAASLGRLAGLADAVLHLAPPALAGASDVRTAHLLARAGPLEPRCAASSTASTTRRLRRPRRCADQRDRAAARPATDRARRRADAEERIRRFGRARRVVATVLRVPGIYALDRAGGDPRERVVRGTPVLAAADDVYTGHIHADDLARACVAALHRGRPQRIVNVVDDSDLRMGDYFDFVADRFGLPRPPRLARGDAAARLSPLQMSFLAESRRLVNERMKRELRLVLRHPTVADGLAAAAPVRTRE